MNHIEFQLDLMTNAWIASPETLLGMTDIEIPNHRYPNGHYYAFDSEGNSIWSNPVLDMLIEDLNNLDIDFSE